MYVFEINKNIQMGNVFYLTEREQRAYWSLLDGIQQMKAEIPLPIGDGDALAGVYKALSYDFPEIELVWDYSGSKYRTGNTTPKGEMRVIMAYKCGREEAKRRLEHLRQVAVSILTHALGRGRHRNVEEILQLVYQYMTEQYHYCEEWKMQKDGSYPGYAYTLDVLLRKEKDGVCLGFSKALTYMLRLMAIPSLVVSGKADGSRGGEIEGHAWNIVKDGCDYYHFDLTWSLGRSRENWWFKMDDMAMRVRRHFWNKRNYPVCRSIA